MYLCLVLFFPGRPPPGSTLFPYTTLFRSRCGDASSCTKGPAGQACRDAITACHQCCECVCKSETAGCTPQNLDRKSTRLNSSHVAISYAVFCLKKKTKYARRRRRDE